MDIPVSPQDVSNFDMVFDPKFPSSAKFEVSFNNRRQWQDRVEKDSARNRENPKSLWLINQPPPPNQWLRSPDHKVNPLPKNSESPPRAALGHGFLDFFRHASRVENKQLHPRDGAMSLNYWDLDGFHHHLCSLNSLVLGDGVIPPTFY